MPGGEALRQSALFQGRRRLAEIFNGLVDGRVHVLSPYMYQPGLSNALKKSRKKNELVWAVMSLLTDFEFS